MTRLLSLIVATIFLVSATVEIASFVMEHESWFYSQYKTAADYIKTVTRPVEPSRKACDKDCGAATPRTDTTHRCDSEDGFARKLLCRFTQPAAETPCRQDCDQKDKPLPGNWIRPEKGSTASLSVR